jgi:ATP-dependent DNA helicase RecQ
MAPPSLDTLRQVIERHWGYRTFRPLQEQAMTAVLQERDSVVVLPTGGGKSLCYQAPAVARGGTTVVVSPLISLMKDQVDSLRACGVPAVQIDSSLSQSERGASRLDLMQGEVRLLFISPERLAMPDFCNLLRKINVRTFAIDEAHCISHWGHDFRPEYRQMGKLKEMFPGATVHAYTATATEQVRRDISTQLKLVKPQVLVGNFDRPNLSYRILPRHDLYEQIQEVLKRHPGEAGIIYCLRRKDVDEVAAELQSKRINCRGYHAGMSPEQRRAAQELFAEEKCDLIVATVAFGMGIDRSNIRFVLHAAMPKSVEHYQQETGRAGRDGLEAECVLLYSGEDYMSWKWLINKSAQDSNAAPDYLPNAMKHLDDIDRYARGAVCRHRALVQYFGQDYDVTNCAACDICLGDTEPVPDAVIIAQKILSCVARVQERFGVNHVISVLRGDNVEKIRSLGHDKLSTYGLLREHPKTELRDWIYQLISQGVLMQEGDEYPILRLNDTSWAVMKKERDVRLLKPVRRRADDEGRKSKADTTSWEGVDRDLFEELRNLRRDWAAAKDVPPYIIFSDATLRELARVRPSSLDKLRMVYGIGDAKLQEFGDRLLMRLKAYCADKNLSMDQASRPMKRVEPAKPVALRPTPSKAAALTGTKATAFELFRTGAAVEDVIHQTNRSHGKIMDFLADYIRQEDVADISPWVSAETYTEIAAVVKQVGVDRLKPIFVALGEKIPYDVIRLVVAHLTR